jgi:hypothetical protein
MARAEFMANVCTRATFWNETNLDQNRELEWCFNNFDGITTTTPSGVGTRFGRFDIYFVVFIGFVNILVNYVQ